MTSVRDHSSRAKALGRIPTWILLAALVTTIAVINALWRMLETRPPLWDMSYHLTNSLFYLNGASLSDPLAFVGAYRYYPPLTYWVADVFYVVVRSEAMWVAVLSNVVWLAILAFATYGIGRRIWSEGVGLLSVAFVLTTPIIIASSKQFELDMPLTAMAAGALYLLIRADGFSSRRYSVLFGAAVGCGLLVKWTFPLVLLLPALYAFITTLRRARLRQFNALLNAVLATEVMLVLAGPWYVANFRQIVSAAQRYNSPELLNPGSSTPTSAVWYLWSLLNSQLYLVPTAMLLAGIVFCFRKREFAARNLYPILLVIGTYLTFSILPNKAPRFTEPMIPALAVIASAWLQYVPIRWRRLITTGFIAYGSLTFAAVSFGTSHLPVRIGFDLPPTRLNPESVTLYAQHGGWPSDEDWHVSDPFESIATFPLDDRSLAYAGPNTVWFNTMGLYYYENRYDVRRVDAAKAHFRLVRGEVARKPHGFTPLRRWQLPDGSKLVLYVRAS